MKQHAGLTLLLLAFVATGCGASCATPCSGSGTGGGGGGGGGGSTPAPNLFVSNGGRPFLAGQTVSVSLGATGTAACGGAESATVVVSDPNDAPVPSSVTLSDGSGGSATLVDVTFDAGGAGWYYVQATLQPNLGLTQGQVLTMAPKGPALDGGPAFCNNSPRSVDQTVLGRWVCDSTWSATGSPSPSPSAVLGNVIWTTAAGTVTRWVDQGATNPLLTASSPTALLPHAVIPLDDQAILLDEGTASAEWFVLDGGSLQSAGVLFVTEAVGPLSGLLEGTRLFLIGQSGLGFDGGDFLTDAGTFLTCTASLVDGGAVRDGPCFSTLGDLLACDGHYVWAVGDGSGRVVAYAPDGGTLSYAGSLPITSDMTATGSIDFPALVQVGVGNGFTVVPQVSGGDVVLEFYPAPQGFSWLGASQRFVWGDGNSGFAVFAR